MLTDKERDAVFAKAVEQLYFAGCQVAAQRAQVCIVKQLAKVLLQEIGEISLISVGK